MNIAQNVERAARLFPDKTAIVFEGTHLTYKSLNAHVNRLANALVADGDRQRRPRGPLPAKHSRICDWVPCHRAHRCHCRFGECHAQG